MAKILPLRTQQQKQAFSDAMREHLPVLYRMAYRLTGNQADSEDLLQDLIAKLYGKPDQLAQLDEPLTWLKRALYHQFVDNYRRARLRPELFSELPGEGGEDLAATRPSPDSGPESWAERAQQVAALHGALDRLSENQRALVLLHDVEGMTLTELEKVLAEPLGTLKSRLHRARRALRELLKDATF